MKDLEYLKQIGANLRKIRTDRSLPRTTVAHQLGISVNSLMKFEDGSTDISVTRLKQLSDAYNVHPSEIFAENSPIAAKIESIRDEMKHYQKLLEKSQQKIIELQDKVYNSRKEYNCK